MKKIVSTCLVVLLLLNVMGYYVVFMGMKYKNSVQIAERLDTNNYREAETITIKFPLSIPYFGDTGFERVSGEIEHQGEYFQLVKQKLEKDTLYIVCIKDVKRKHIQKALTAYVKTFSGKAAESTNAKTIPNFIKDYVSTSFNLGAFATGWSATVVYYFVPVSFSNPYSTNTAPPPKS
jgi:hypothetical protein